MIYIMHSQLLVYQGAYKNGTLKYISMHPYEFMS